MRTSKTIAFAAAAALAWSAAAQADVIRVPGDLPTIQDAVNAAQPGDTIKIGKGPFTEDVTISGKSKLRIRGSGKKTVITDSWVAFRIMGSTDITLQNLVIDQADEAGVWISDSAGITMQRCVVRNVTWHGIVSERCERLLVDRCTVDNIGDDGISFSGYEGGGLTNDSTVKSCRVTRCGDGGIVVRGVGNLVRSCYVRDVGNDGVQTEDSGGDSDTSIVKTKVQNTGDEGFEIDGQGTTVVKCTSRDSDSDGFDVETDDCELIKCTSKKSGDDAFDIEGARCRMEKCKSIQPLGSGFVIAGAECELEKCKSVKAGDDAYHLDPAAAGSILRRNKATKSGGLDLNDGTPPDSCTFERNKLKKTNS